MREGPIRVLVVDDHPMMRQGVAFLIEREPDMALAGEAGGGEEAIDLHGALHPDITLLDLQMPGMSGLDVIRAIRSRTPKAAILVLTTYGGDEQILQAMRAGAAGYVLKSCARRELADAIRSILAGKRALSAEVAQDLAAHALDDRLTERETSILRLVAQGSANKQIAHELGVSVDTVKAHLKNIYAKLDVDDRTLAVVVATKRGYISL
jgi:DNA-binding NarL/FixJ family response regulator